jgi:hypothetical protein
VKQIESVRALARTVGISHTALAKWLKDDRWPFARKGPWPVSLVGKMKAWAAVTLAENPAAAAGEVSGAGDVGQLGPERRAKLAKILVQTRRAQFQHDRDKGLYHRVDECDRRIVRKIHDAKSKLLNAHSAAPADTPPHVREWMRLELERICREFAGEINTAPINTTT